MRQAPFMLGMTLAAGIAGGVFGTQVLYGQLVPVKRTVLCRTALEGMEGKEGVVSLITLAPGAAIGKHFHAGHEFVHVLEGSTSVKGEEEPPLTVREGGTFDQLPQQVHDFTNTSKTTPLKVLVLLIGGKDQPLATPAK